MKKMKAALDAFEKQKKPLAEDKFAVVVQAFVNKAQSRVDKMLAEAEEAKADVEKVGEGEA